MIYDVSYFHPSGHSICVRANGGHCCEPSPSLGRHSSQEVLFTQTLCSAIVVFPFVFFHSEVPAKPFPSGRNDGSPRAGGGIDGWFGDVPHGPPAAKDCAPFSNQPFTTPSERLTRRGSAPWSRHRGGKGNGKGKGKGNRKGKGPPQHSLFSPTELSALYGTALYVLGGLLSRGMARSVTG